MCYYHNANFEGKPCYGDAMRDELRRQDKRNLELIEENEALRNKLDSLFCSGSRMETIVQDNQDLRNQVGILIRALGAKQ
jgi:hypothetical protein